MLEPGTLPESPADVHVTCSVPFSTAPEEEHEAAEVANLDPTVASIPKLSLEKPKTISHSPTKLEHFVMDTLESEEKSTTSDDSSSDDSSKPSSVTAAEPGDGALAPEQFGDGIDGPLDGPMEDTQESKD